jgi:hypothetical protein
MTCLAIHYQAIGTVAEQLELEDPKHLTSHDLSNFLVVALTIAKALVCTSDR